MYPQSFVFNLCIMRLYYACRDKKTKELISQRNCTADLRFCFFSKSNRRFNRLSHKATFTMHRGLKIFKNSHAFAVDFSILAQYLWFCCVLGCCNIDLALIGVPGQVRPICSALVISFIHEGSYITDTKSFN